MKVFEYICKSCGRTFETDKIVSGREFRHMKEDAPKPTICGVVHRNWKSVNINRDNLRAAR